MSDTPQPQPPPTRDPQPAEIVEEPLPDWDDDPDEDVGEWPPPPARSNARLRFVLSRFGAWRRSRDRS